VPTTACPADSRKAYCKVCNNGIINRFFAIVVKNIEIIQKICQNEHRSELLMHFEAKEVRYRSKYTIIFWAELRHQKRFSLFYRQKCHAKLFSQRSSVLLLLRNMVRDSDNFFSSLLSLEVKLLWRNALACGKG